ncbi:MAG: DNA polymerase IV [Treponemataceae bacterium]
MISVIFHADMDAFFASIEQLDDPNLRGKPVVVGAAPGRRGVVSACSYEARTFGIRSAMPISRAYRLCPQAVYLPVRMDRYRELSNRVINLFGEFTPDVRPISVDEAFLDMSGTERLFGPPRAAAALLKKRVREEIGLTVSVGIGPNRYVAKLASARSKPDGLLEVDAERVKAFMAALPLTSVWGIGDKTRERLLSLGLDSVDRICSFSQEALAGMTGEACGAFLYNAVRGIDPGIFSDEPKSHSMSSEATYEHDVTDDEVLEATLLALSQEIMWRLIEEGARSRTVHLKLRYDDFETISAQETLGKWISSSDDIRFAAISLLEKKRDENRAVRLIGVGVSNVESERGVEQGELFEDGSERKAKVERAVMDLKQKRGALLTKARLIAAPSKNGSSPGKT